MSKVSTLLILLASVNVLKGHALGRLNSKSFFLHWNDETGPAQECSVRDWDLICTQLCSSELGGHPCGCSNEGAAEVGEDEYELEFIDGDLNAVCPILCQNGLGGTRCDCKLKLLIDEADGEEICSAFCLADITDLQGCMPDEGLETTTTDESVEETTIPSSSETTDVPEETTTEEITTTTTTTTTTTAIPTTTTQPTTTTPDWNELCQTLCKIGEGGALCTCDLPPFF